MLHPTTINHSGDEWGRMTTKYFSPDDQERKQASAWIDSLCQEITNELGGQSSPEVFFDLPTPPRFQISSDML